MVDFNELIKDKNWVITYMYVIKNNHSQTRKHMD